MFGEMADMLAEPSSMAGLPGISVPCGFIDGLPIGLDIIGSQYSEAKLLQVAFAYEQSTSWHIKKPKIYKLINEKN
ncbi:MAG: Glutamyl-tRNA(Gln) amidotransferase subunit A [Candidatus Woesebacteria bacterium GW2011_GWA1_37_7]|uniref:Glutamyl-tRNA(Gln) amidotransferase subunit A n=1 Tax=Candidatus Woesebacteria bacterium GW2011_GWA1_37_7 TaxID=1618545 RepID=A0A0G0H6U8_9BACT|nr:MAG: Glutamyl-tRNA(Gln) amidotransferase subunit A [Candidatus Woesebacteria bacterium GW2011_GWA1_37_7]